MKSQKLLSLLLAACALTAVAQTTDDAHIYEGVPFDMPRVVRPTFPDYAVDIRDFGAVNDGVTLCTEAVNKAIAHVNAKGGGKVVIPAGLWISGPIELLSNVNLYTEYGALVVFTSDLNAYEIVDTSFEGLDTRRCQSPIYARKAHNIAITGYGTFDGSGEDWRPVKKGKVTSSQWKKLLKKSKITNEKGDVWYPSEESKRGAEACFDFNVPDNITDEEDWNKIKRWLRPTLLNFQYCDTVLLENAMFKNSPAWCLHPLRCSHVTIDGVKVNNPWYAQNGDALDLESCRNALIINSIFDAGDDAICIKSGKDADGRRHAMPCENVIVRNNTVLHGHGGFVVGSEMSGGARNIYITDCSFIGTDVGLRFKSTRGRGGVVEGIYIENIAMVNIPEEPLLFDLFYGKRGKATADEVPPVSEETPVFRDIHIKDVVCRGAGRAMYFNGLPEMKISNVTIENVSILNAALGIVINQSTGVELKNVCVEPVKGSVLSLNGADNVVIEGLRTTEQAASAQVGTGCEKVTIKKSDVNRDNTVFAEGVSDKVVKFK